VAAGADGDFIVAWSSFTDGSGSGVLARRFASSGEPLTITPMAMPGELYEIPTLSGRALGSSPSS
jgi:hypothetical protein